MARRRRVLIVDDEPDILEQILELLDQSYELVVAINFQEAVDAFNGKNLDAAVLDIMGVNGEELLARFHSFVPCIMLTAHALSPAQLKRSVSGGARLYLPKDEMIRLPEYIEQVVRNPGASLWRWLLERLNFRRWFGSGVDEIEREMKSGPRAPGAR